MKDENEKDPVEVTEVVPPESFIRWLVELSAGHPVDANNP